MKVAIIKNDSLDYNRDAPFNPSIKYPEYPFNEFSRENAVYDSVREILRKLGMDKEHFNTGSWNPLGEVIKPGDNVLIKPNLVLKGGEELTTQGSVIRAVLDYVYIALKNSGTITIGDAPIQSANFDEIARMVGLDKIVEFYDSKNINIKIEDFRFERTFIDKFGFMSKVRYGSDVFTIVNLKQDSELCEIDKDYKKFRVTNYDKERLSTNHNKTCNQYLIPNVVLNSDVIINLPKLKTHKLAGMTCALKNMVGVNGSKGMLAHHRFGSAEEGGDEYLHKSIRKKLLTIFNEKMDTSTNRLQFLLYRTIHTAILATKFLFKYEDNYFEGSWYGNDTVPRTITDINKIVFYADKKGVLRDNVQRKMFILVDAIVAGEKEGPLQPTPKKCGVLVAGYNPVAVDLVCSRIMGFDYRKIPTFKYAVNAKKYKILDSENIALSDSIYNCNFIPHTGWKGHIEK